MCVCPITELIFTCLTYSIMSKIFEVLEKLIERVSSHPDLFSLTDLDAKNIQSGRGPRSDSDLLKWDNEINTFDDDYEGKFDAKFSIQTHDNAQHQIIY